MSLELSKRIQRLKTSPIRKLTPYAEKAVASGKKIYHLNIGQPDIEISNLFFEGVAGYEEKILKYEHSAGIKELREKVQAYYKKHGMDYSIEDILITSGGSEALQFCLSSIFDEGDEVLIGEPYYANYNSYFDVMNIKPNPVITYAENGYHFTSLEELESRITKKTKGFIFSNPSNPTGTVYTKEELDNIAYLAKKYNLYIISDEAYREYAYGDNKCISFGTYKDIEDHVIIIDSISKRFSACGARIGCLISKNKNFIESVYRQCQARLSVPTLEMLGAAALYDLPEEELSKYRSLYEERRNFIFNEFKTIDDIIVKEPEGAFYSFVKLPVENAEDFCIWLLSEFDIDGETIMIAPGEGFYATEGLGRNEVRICYATDIKDLKKAMNIFREGLKKYQRIKCC